MVLANVEITYLGSENYQGVINTQYYFYGDIPNDGDRLAGSSLQVQVFISDEDGDSVPDELDKFPMILKKVLTQILTVWETMQI